MIRRRHLLAGALVLALPAPAVRAARTPVLAVAPSGDTGPPPAGWRLLAHPDPIAAVVSGDADAASDGHRDWTAMPPALLCFGGLPGGLAPAVRDAWLASNGGRRLWDAHHARAGLHALVLDGRSEALMWCDGCPAALGLSDGPRPAAGPTLARILGGHGLPIAGRRGGQPFGDGTAGPPWTVTVRIGGPTPPIRSAPVRRETAALLPLDWRVALADAAAAFVDGLARGADPLDRATVEALRDRVRSDRAKNNLA